MSIIISKTGSVVYGEDKFYKASLLGDQHNAIGIIKFLVDKYDDVVFAGRFNGTPPEGLSMVETDLTDLRFEWDDKAQQHAGDDLVDRLRAYDPSVWIDISGSSATKSWIDNPTGVGVKLSSARYIGPLLYAMQELQLPRVCIVTDMRNMPRNHEMGWWPYTRPVAVLGQETIDGPCTMLGHRYRTVCHYAGVENWFSFGIKPLPVQGEGCVIFAHSHLKDLRWSRGRNETWNTVFDMLDECGFDWRVHGLHWDVLDTFLERRLHFKDAIDASSFYSVLESVRWGIVLPPAEGFLTTKVRKYALKGALPMLWSGDRLRYDPDGLVFPMDHAARFSCASDLSTLIDDSFAVKSLVADIELRTRPDFSALSDCIDSLHAGVTPKGEDWLMRFGGYVRA